MPTRQFHLAPLGKVIAASWVWPDVRFSITADVPAPAFLTNPSIATPDGVSVGSVATGIDGTFVNGTLSARQWLRDDVIISGAFGTSYTFVEADIGALITYRNIIVGVGGATVSATSAAVGVFSISGSPATTAAVGVPYSFTPTLFGGNAPYAFSLTGDLPPGLSFNPATGAITGTPA